MAIKTRSDIIIDDGELKYQDKTLGNIVPRRSDKNNCPWLAKDSGDTYYHCERRDKKLSIGFGIGAGGENHGIWSGGDSGLNTWLLHCSSANKEVYIKNKIPLRYDYNIKIGQTDHQNLQYDGGASYALHYFKTVNFGYTFPKVPKVFVQYRSDSVSYGFIPYRIGNVTTTKFDLYVEVGNLSGIYWDWVALSQ